LFGAKKRKIRNFGRALYRGNIQKAPMKYFNLFKKAQNEPRAGSFGWTASSPDIVIKFKTACALANQHVDSV
jgi:hypothetical protein